MTRIDRYILFLYVRILVICFASLAGLMIVVQVFTNLDELMRYAEQRGQSLLQVMVEYFGPRALTIIDQLSGLIALLALLFVIAWLYRTNEFTALMAAGVTKWRVLRPLLIASASVILGASMLREFAIPLFQDKLERSPQDLTGQVGLPVKPTYDYRACALLTGRNMLPIKQEVAEPSLLIRQGPLTAGFGRQLSAAVATFQAGVDGKPSGYWLQNVSQPKNIDAIDSVYALDGSPLLLTRKNTDWLEPNSCFFVSEIDFELLRGGSSRSRYASIAELVGHLRNGEKNGRNDLRTQIHQRLLRPFADWTLLLLAIPILLGRPDRHVFVVAGSCLFLVVGFSGFVMGLGMIGRSGYLIDPVNAVWLPLVLFLPWGWARTSHAMNS